MTKIYPAFATLFIVLLTTASNSVSAADQTIMLDGREILLREDGTWLYQSTDRFANTRDGSHVRLKEDGSWQYVGNAPLISKQQVRTTDLDFQLEKVVIETYKRKSQKSSLIKTQTVFYVRLKNSAQAKNSVSINKDDIALIEVKDNNGKRYEVVSVKPNPVELKPDALTTLIVRAEKSPSIFDDVKSMELVFKSGIFGIEAPISLKQRTIDFYEETVDGFQ